MAYQDKYVINENCDLDNISTESQKSTLKLNHLFVNGYKQYDSVNVDSKRSRSLRKSLMDRKRYKSR